MTLALDPDVGLGVAQDAVARAGKAGATSAKAVHTYTECFEVNFETGAVSLIRSTVNDDLTITAYADDRKGSAELTGRDHDSVDAAVGEALEAARASEPDPANVLPADQAEPALDSGDEAPDKEEMVGVVARFVEVLAREHPAILSRSSTYSFVNIWRSYANSHGRTQHARNSQYATTFTLAGRDEGSSTSFQYCSVTSASPVTDLAALPAIMQCLADTENSFGARPVPETFVGDIIVTPMALSALVASVTQALSGMALMKKTTPYRDRLGEQIASPLFSLLHRPQSLPGGAAFDGEGYANVDLDIVTDGLLQNFIVDWYMSHRLGRPMTSGCVDLEVAAGDESLDAIIAGTERGIVLGRYSGGNPNQNLDFSGVAKNSFYVEDGKIAGPVNETMVAGNLASLLQDIKAVSSQQLDYGYYRMPWVAAGGVTISTK